MTDLERYALGLMVEEFGETLKIIGKAMRFGLDTPGFKDPVTGEVDMAKTPRAMLPLEMGDVAAALVYATERGIVDMAAIEGAMEQKIRRLLNPGSKDNLGRRLAP